MSRITATFAHLANKRRKALIPFITAGDPSPEITIQLMHTMVEAGADIIELGVPFSDPMADGPTIQRASERALAQGVSLRQVLAIAKQFRQKNSDTPVVLMGYANPIESMGIDTFAEAAQGSGIDGVLVVDYPPEEATLFARAICARQIDPIYLLSPTSTTERFRQIAALAKGYVYYVSLKGVTGAGHLDVASVAERILLIRSMVGLPVGVGFGIRDAQTARQLAETADAIVVGSRLIEEIEQSTPETVCVRVGSLVRDLRQGIDELVGASA